MEINQYSVYWVNLDPVIGSEVSKTKPCIVLSPNELNSYLRTIIIAPLTHILKPYPTRVACKINGEDGMVMIDQIKTIDKSRLVKYMGKLNGSEIEEIKSVINELLC